MVVQAVTFKVQPGACGISCDGLELTFTPDQQTFTVAPAYAPLVESLGYARA